MVRVANVDEAGDIELSPVAPTVGKAVTAELEDVDGVQARTVTWVWSSKVDSGCDTDTTFNRGDRITGATSDTYTPAAAECLRVTARYDGRRMVRMTRAPQTDGRWLRRVRTTCRCSLMTTRSSGALKRMRTYGACDCGRR